MSAKPIVKVIPKTLDLVALEAMVEPLTLQVSRVKGPQHSPITLPQGENNLAGVGLSKSEIKEINEGWLAREWCGGGLYQFTVTDASTPPVALTWQSWYSTSEFGPERAPGTPPTQVMPPAAPATAPAPTPQPAQVHTTMSQFPNGLPQLPPMYYPQPATPQYAAPSYPAAPPSYGYGYGGFSAQGAADAERRRMEERLANAEAQLVNARVEAEKRQFEITLERERSANQAALQRLEQRFSEMTTAKAQPSISPELEALKEQNRAMEARLDAERREREMERRERESRDQLAAMKASIDAQIAATNANMQQLLAASQQNKSDPLVQLMIQQSRDSVAAMERIASQSSQAIEKFQGFMMKPADLVAFSRDSSQANDLIMQKVGNAFGSALEMQGKVLENALSLNQGGSPVVDLVREGVSSVKDMAERYVTSTNRMKQVEAQSQAEIAKANASVEVSRANATARQHMPQPMPQPMPRPMPQPGLGHTNGVNGKQSFEEWQKQRAAAAAAATGQPARETSNAQATPVPTAPANNMGRTDVQWFGPAYGEVLQTRQAVMQFLMELQKPNPQIYENSPTPDAVAKGILTAAAMVAQQNIPVPAMTELLGQGKYEEFARVLLPQAPPAYIEDLCKAMRSLNGEEEPEPEEPEEPEEPGDEEPGDENGEIAADGSPVDDVEDGAVHVEPPAKPTKPTIRVVPARA